jgi:uncharacterized protein involved in tolerance to divalent cations
MSEYLSIYITAPSVDVADALGRALVEERLPACVNIIPEMRSIYRWAGGIETAAEIVLIAKSRAALFEEIEKRVRQPQRGRPQRGEPHGGEPQRGETQRGETRRGGPQLGQLGRCGHYGCRPHRLPHLRRIRMGTTLSDKTTQRNLIITRTRNESEITVDNIEVAQFIYLLLNNTKIRDVIDTITSKVVLILGRFTPERKQLLDALRNELRSRNYLPVVFDFEKASSQTTDETITLLARMARFVIADLSDAKSILQELRGIVPEGLSLCVRGRKML